MPETAMKEMMQARESRSVDHLTRIIRAREIQSVDHLVEQIEPLAQALAVLVKESKLQHKALSLTVTRTMIGIAVGVGLLVGIASGIGSWVMLKEHYIKTELANASILRPGLLLVKPAAPKYTIPLPISDNQKKLIPKEKMLETKDFKKVDIK